MNDFSELLRELGVQRDRGTSGGGGGDNAVQIRPAPPARQDVPFQFAPDKNFAKATGAALGEIMATQRATARAMAANQAAGLQDRQRAIVTQARGVLMKCATDGTMSAEEVAIGESALHRAVARLGL